MIICGVDEAGYGPTLGPLVMTACALRVPDGPGGPDVWEILADWVARSPVRRETRLVVADSKKMYSPATGLWRLEETVLAFLQAGGRHFGMKVDETITEK